MATIDSAQRRASMLTFGDGVILHLLPESNGMIEPDEQQHLLGLYSLLDPLPGDEIGPLPPAFEGLRRHAGRLLK